MDSLGSDLGDPSPSIASISCMDEESQIASLLNEENQAINDHEYEKAEALFMQRQALIAGETEKQKVHYSDQQTMFAESLRSKLQKELQSNTDNADVLLSEVSSVYQNCVASTKKIQEQEVQLCRQEWDKTRESVRKKLDTTVDSMLETSKRLAKSHQFSEAIRIRDRALSIKEDDKHPDLVAIDLKFQDRLGKIRDRHMAYLKDLEIQYSQKKQLIENERNNFSAACISSHLAQESASPHLIIESVLGSTTNIETAQAVIRAVSPRKRQEPSLKNENIIRSPERLGRRKIETPLSSLSKEP